ncbi:hypothetical protein [Erythrobacter sp. R86502]|uniref:hypothetical protein n=1 Tax=Erythrobacter sp. R86502 TaxID=3093846 RepID=UPI0036D3353D
MGVAPAVGALAADPRAELGLDPGALADTVGNIENLVALTSGQYTMGSLILMVSFGAHFAFLLYFLMTSTQLAPRYRLVPVMSSIVMLSAGLSLMQEFNL